jgi:NOL1/NOP2/fmu family ribosome biogenesis protein
MTAPEEICKLIEHFEQNREALRSGKYNEAQLRQEFLNPFFTALGWDMFNEQQFGEAYKEVIHETSVEVEGAAKAPDYAFRIGGVTKFFVEAKKPSVNIEHAIHPAYQVKRYAWSAKLPLAILSDFEEFAVYDCRSKPNPGDQAATGRVMYLTYRDYIEKWDEIAAIFSKNAIQKGAFDQYAQGVKGKRGTKEVDDAFLEEMEGWRETLARNLAIRNPELENVRQLNYAVQMTIDRIVFLRICEDRGIEKEGQLKELTLESGIYANLCGLFRTADKRYNSGLFHFEKEKDQSSHPDDLTPRLKVDDKVLKEIICDLYYPSPYVFKLIPADILGQVYERFLGKVIRLTAGHQAKVEEKPEVRKAGGVYYTPTYIVEYIVKNTVGKLLEGKTPAEAGALKIVDPACGSGSFLLGAFQYLIDWHCKYYQEHDPEKWAKGSSPAVYRGQGGEWQLTTREKKRILLNNLHGVDIDPQAVEVTKLSLLLKVLEEESGQLSLGFERALPDLGRNIQCGNSLIGSDYYDDRQLSMGFMDDEERQRVNAFDWQTAFPQVFAKGGFDAVIGNPPYVRQESLGSQKEYFQKHFQTYQGSADLYTYFIEKGVRLLRTDGLFSYIVANKWMRANYGKPLRKWMNEQCIEEIIDFGDLPVFEQATTYPCILRIRAGKKPLPTFNSVKVGSLDFNDLETYVNQNSIKVDPSKLDDEGWSLSDEQSSGLLKKLRQHGIPLGEYVKGRIFRGILTGLNEAFVINAETRKRLIEADIKSAQLIVPFLAGRDIKRYETPKSDKYLIFTRHGIKIEDYPEIERYLFQFKSKLMPKPRDWSGDKWSGRKPGTYKWYEIQDSIDYYQEFLKPKIIIPAIVQNGSYAYDEDGIFSNDKTTIIPNGDFYLLGILNSKLADFVLHSIASTKQGGYFEYKPMYVSQLPIHKINPLDKNDILIQEKIKNLVERILGLHKRIVFTPQEKESIHREIEATDKQIDQLVYELYGLTEEEIKIVEEGK